MGYLSDIVICMTPEKEYEFKFLGISNAEEWPYSREVQPDSTIRYTYRGVKWYQSYPEVPEAEKWFSTIPENTYCFIRVGEGDGYESDIEMLGDEERFGVGVSMFAEIIDENLDPLFV